MRARVPGLTLVLALAAVLVAAPAAAPAAPASAARASGTPSAEALQRIEALTQERHFAAADSTARALWRQAAAAEGDSSLAVAQVLHALVLVMVLEGRAGDPECLSLAQRSLAIREARLDENDPDVAWGLERLARVYRDRGEYAQARPFAERAVGILQLAFGPDALEAALGHNTLGSIEMRLGQPEAAREQFQRLLAIRQRHLPPDDPEIAAGQHNIAITYLAQEDLDHAEPLLRQALEIRERALGPDHPLVGATLNMLGLVAGDRGQTRQAIELQTRALRIRERASGPDHPEVVAAMLNLGMTLQHAQEYARARELYERAVGILERAYGPSHPDLRHPLQSLAQIHFIQGDTPAAIALAERALQVLEGALGPEHPDVGLHLNELAEFHRDAGEVDLALTLLERARKILLQAHGSQSAQLAHTYQYMADIQRGQHRYDEALANYGRARINWEAAYGHEHRLVAAALMGLASVHRDRGEDGQAAALWDQALAIYVKVLGPEHHHVAGVLHQQARMLARQGRTADALDKALQAERIGRAQLRASIRNLAEGPGLLYAADRSEGAGLNVALSLAARGVLATADVRRVWDALIEARAFVLDEMGLRRRALRELVDPDTRALWERLAKASAELSKATYGAGDAAVVERAQRERDAIETELAARSATFRAQQARLVTALADVERALPGGTALVSYARYVSAHDRQPRYVALVRDAHGRLASWDLGPAAAIDAACDDWRQQAGAGALRPLAQADEQACWGAALALHRLVWEPLAPMLDGAQAVYVVPDGHLQLVNLLALPGGGQGRYLVEDDRLIHTLAAERDLLLPPASGLRDDGLLALGNPDFDAAASQPPPTAAGASSGVQMAAMGMKAEADGLRGDSIPCRSFDQVQFNPLPRSGDEVAEIAALWRRERGEATTLTGAAAGEASFKTMAAGRRALHLATHGFFLGDRCQPALPGQRGVGGTAPTREAPQAVRGNPLLLSGLAVAGANARHAAAAGGEDGILTAEEIATLDLGSCEWAVLSACETGMGIVQAGEGVLGLRRAFQIAGVRTVIMSLWSVQDEAARRWMTALYTARLQGGATTAECMQRAARTVLAARRARGESTHPHCWAGFTATGDGR